MNKKTLIACLSVVACLEGNNPLFAADEPAADMGGIVAQDAHPGDKDLLMFMEEKDLVTATKRTVSLRKAPAIATIIDADEIRNMGARNLLDVLKMVPGLGVAINEYNSMMVEVRGIRSSLSEKILVMIDSHSLNRNINGSSLYRTISYFPLENVKQIEIIRGPGSALYGNSAFMATINIITRNAEEINGGELKAGGGSFDTWKANLVGGKTFGDKLTVTGSVDQYQTNGPKLRVAADTLTGTPFSQAPGDTNLYLRQTDAFLKVGYGDLTFRGHYHTKKQGMNVGIVAALTDDSSKTQVDNYWAELAYNQKVAEGISATMKLSYDYYEQDPFMKIYPNGFRGLFPEGMIGKPLVKDRTFSGEVQVDWDVFTGNHLIGGVSFEAMEQYDTRQLTNFNLATGLPLAGGVQEVANWNKDAMRRIWALYLQDEWQLPYRINLTAGVRYDHYSDFGDTVNPRVGLVWSFLENADLKLLYGQAFRAPTFNELYNSNNLAAIGGTGIKPEKITTYEAGITWRFNRNLVTNANYFYSTITDQIVQTGLPAVYVNRNQTNLQGVEVGLSGAVSNDLSWKTNYTWQDVRDDSTSRRVAFVPSHRASGSLNYAPAKYLNLHTDVLWTGPRLRLTGDTRGEAPDYTTVDLAATFKNLYKGLEIQAAIHNLFDRRFSDPDTSSGLAGSRNLAGTGPKVPGDFPREGISAMVTATYKF